MKKAKNNSQKTNRYNGYNAFGLRCEVKTVKLNRENALEQWLWNFWNKERPIGRLLL